MYLFINYLERRNFKGGGRGGTDELFWIRNLFRIKTVAKHVSFQFALTNLQKKNASLLYLYHFYYF
jgi:hypothetical protein